MHESRGDIAIKCTSHITEILVHTVKQNADFHDRRPGLRLCEIGPQFSAWRSFRMPLIRSYWPI